MGKLGTFVDTRIVAELAKKGATEEDIELVSTKGEQLAADIFTETFMKCLQQITDVFRIMVGSTRATEEIIAASNYGWKVGLINNKNFPMRPMPEGLRRIAFLQFDHDPYTEEVLAEAKRQGLERPRYEDALFFGEQCPEEQHTAPVVFLHEPWSRRGRVLVLDYDGRVSGLFLLRFDRKWPQRCRFAFVRK